MGAKDNGDVAGLLILPQNRPRNAVEWQGFWFHAQTGEGNFTVRAP